MPNLQFVEYTTGLNGGYTASGNTFVFDPRPVNITKDVSVKWRIRRPGYQRKIERARFRYNEKILIKITGSCVTDKRDELEWFAKRDSLYKVLNLDMKTFHSEQTSDCDYPTPSSYAAAKAQDSGEGAGQGESVYVVFESVKFTQREAKINWFDYAITLRRIHLTRH